MIFFFSELAAAMAASDWEEIDGDFNVLAFLFRDEDYSEDQLYRELMEEDANEEKDSKGKCDQRERPESQSARPGEDSRQLTGKSAEADLRRVPSTSQREKTSLKNRDPERRTEGPRAEGPRTIGQDARRWHSSRSKRSCPEEVSSEEYVHETGSRKSSEEQGHGRSDEAEGMEEEAEWHEERREEAHRGAAAAAAAAEQEERDREENGNSAPGSEAKDSSAETGPFTEGSVPSGSRPDGADVKKQGRKRARGVASIVLPSSASFGSAALAGAEKKPEKFSSSAKAETRRLQDVLREARFFLLKSCDHENISLAKAEAIWWTLPATGRLLNAAFRSARSVIVLFSVSQSRKFQGFARLASESQHGGPPEHWVLPRGMNPQRPGAVFHIDWLCRYELPFSQCEHLRNALNKHQPVKIGRDGQEVDLQCGTQLCLLFPPDERVDLYQVIPEVHDKRRLLSPFRSRGCPSYRERIRHVRRRHESEEDDDVPHRRKKPRMDYAAGFHRRPGRTEPPGRRAAYGRFSEVPRDDFLPRPYDDDNVRAFHDRRPPPPPPPPRPAMSPCLRREESSFRPGHRHHALRGQDPYSGHQSEAREARYPETQVCHYDAWADDFLRKTPAIPSIQRSGCPGREREGQREREREGERERSRYLRRHSEKHQCQKTRRDERLMESRSQPWRR